ncbi:MAG: thioredoxin [Flavobacteriales bacterium]|nr:thioredoxin [Flavobacteriales bacterium]
MSKFSELINSDKPVLVDFFAEWCGPCKVMAPILKEAKASLGDSAKIIKVDVDKNQQVAAEYQVRSVPTLMLFKDGQVVWKQSGVVPANDLISIIQQY